MALLIQNLKFFIYDQAPAKNAFKAVVLWASYDSLNWNYTE